MNIGHEDLFEAFSHPPFPRLSRLLLAAELDHLKTLGGHIPD
jgi:hypothetical protein